ERRLAPPRPARSPPGPGARLGRGRGGADDRRADGLGAPHPGRIEVDGLLGPAGAEHRKAPMSDYLEIAGLTRRFSAHAGVFDVSLTLAAGRTLALLGPSGSGKTTTLRLLGGFETPDAGAIRVD